MTRRGSAIAIVLGTALGLTGCTGVGPARRPTTLPPMFGTRPAPLTDRPGVSVAATSPGSPTSVANLAQSGGGLFGRRPNRKTMALAAALAQRGQTSTTLARYFPGLGLPGQERPASTRPTSPAVRSFDAIDRRALALRMPSSSDSYRARARSKAPLDTPLLPVALNVQVYPDDIPRDSARLATRARPAATTDEPARPPALSQPDDALNRHGLDPYDPAGLANRPEPAPIEPEIVESTRVPADSGAEPAAEPGPVANADPPPVVEAGEPAADTQVASVKEPVVAEPAPIPLTADPADSIPPSRRVRPIGSPSQFSTALFPPTYYDKDDQNLPKDEMVEPTQAPPRPRILKRLRERVTARLASSEKAWAGRLSGVSAMRSDLLDSLRNGSARRTGSEPSRASEPGSVGGEAGDVAERR